MSDLLTYQVKICPTAIGVLIHQGEVLLLHHKKLKLWMAPGGHQENDELLFQTAEREFLEETGIRVRALDPFFQSVDTERQTDTDTQYVPSPVLSNLHWISRENYDARVASATPSERQYSKLWPNGCEQHIGYLFLVEPVGALDIAPAVGESATVRWFSQDEVAALSSTEMPANIKAELQYCFSLAEHTIKK